MPPHTHLFLLHHLVILSSQLPLPPPLPLSSLLPCHAMIIVTERAAGREQEHQTASRCQRRPGESIGLSHERGALFFLLCSLYHCMSIILLSSPYCGAVSNPVIILPSFICNSSSSPSSSPSFFVLCYTI